MEDVHFWESLGQKDDQEITHIRHNVEGKNFTVEA